MVISTPAAESYLGANRWRFHLGLASSSRGAWLAAVAIALPIPLFFALQTINVRNTSGHFLNMTQPSKQKMVMSSVDSVCSCSKSAYFE
ncbi:MAG: hypothetical protein GTO53_06895 [Planctomycetales bacterium]|nr:hypothetical protein [Planctomycetales bacterium]NIM08862.1 hypothetical protein [Planctomycetales bacterium]NIN08322.1 hypothetical protein [Planctomycetales bacterium]NIO46421.1 hypothetical protein [Planctomycetales bacterium]NIP04500.1 hypothetical protein [Planctomycetales bacterium]